MQRRGRIAPIANIEVFDRHARGAPHLEHFAVAAGSDGERRVLSRDRGRQRARYWAMRTGAFGEWGTRRLIACDADVEDTLDEDRGPLADSVNLYGLRRS